MSRRRKPPTHRKDRCKLVCTDRGQHPETLLGWVRLHRGDAIKGVAYRSDGTAHVVAETEPDELFYSSSADIHRGDIEREWDTVSHFDEFGRQQDGRKGLRQEDRERYRFRACGRCGADTPFREDRLLAIVREALDSGVSRLDVSRLR